MTYSTTEMMFLPRIENLGGGHFIINIFTHPDLTYVKPPQIGEVNAETGIVGTFDEGDYPYKEHQGFPVDLQQLYEYIPNNIQVAVEFNQEKVFVTHNAPVEGFYLSLEVEFTPREEEEGEGYVDIQNQYDVLVTVKDGYYLNEPDNRPLSEDEKFTIGLDLETEEWRKIFNEYYSMYMIVNPFAYNKDLLESLLQS